MTTIEGIAELFVRLGIDFSRRESDGKNTLRTPNASIVLEDDTAAISMLSTLCCEVDLIDRSEIKNLKAEAAAIQSKLQEAELKWRDEALKAIESHILQQSDQPDRED